MIAYVEPAVMSDGSLFPGLFNVATEDGRHFIDLTPAQVESVAFKFGYELRAVQSIADESEATDG